MLTEHFGGKWPFWLSPRQAIVIPIAKDHEPYADMVAQRLCARRSLARAHAGLA